MDMKVIKIGKPVLSVRRSIQAVSANGVAVAFPEPDGLTFALNQVLSIDLEAVDIEQVARNLTLDQNFALLIPAKDMHDLRLPSGPGTSRFPSLARRRGA